MELNEQIGETNAGNTNVSNALSFAQTQDGYLQQVSAALNQMATLAISAQDPTKSAAEVADYQSQFAALQSTIQSALSQKFNGANLFGSGTNLSVAAGNGTTVSLTAINPGGGANLTLALADDLSTSASGAATDVEAAITELATARGNVGANEEQLTYAGNELGVLSTNLAAAKSTITDVDVATGKHQLRQVPNPRAVRHGDVGPGQSKPAVHSQAPPIRSP